MNSGRTISVPHITRVEGHGNIHVEIRDGRLVDARWEVVETPRFFEAMLVGKSWENAPWLCGRICGICSIGHTLASIRAVERAFGIEATAQTEKLRLLLKHMETLQSHALHVFFLVLPDLLNVGSVLPLVESHPDLVKRAARIKGFANRGGDMIGGRRLHPTRTVVGGFTMLPGRKELRDLADGIVELLDDLALAVDLVAGLPVPDFVRETEYVSLKANGRYPFIGGDLISSDGVTRREDDYLAMTNEYCVPQSTAKRCRLSRDSFAVGALARVNNNFQLLHPEARKTAGILNLAPPCHNPFMNTAAQLVECVHVAHESRQVIDELLAMESGEVRQRVRPRAGRGVGAVEVPRGILYHCYEFDNGGRIAKADCVIPTGQNHGNIQQDLEVLVDLKAGEGAGDEEIGRLARMLVRAYDPCISCSVH